MTSILQFSDIHFGVEDRDSMAAVHEFALGLRPDLITYKADGKDYIRDANLLNISSPKAIESAASDLTFELASVPRLGFVDLLDVGTRSLINGWRESERVHVDHVTII